MREPRAGGVSSPGSAGASGLALAGALPESPGVMMRGASVDGSGSAPGMINRLEGRGGCDDDDMSERTSPGGHCAASRAPQSSEGRASGSRPRVAPVSRLVHNARLHVAHTTRDTGAPRVRPSVGPIAATRLEVRVDRGLVLPGRAWVADHPRAPHRTRARAGRALGALRRTGLRPGRRGLQRGVDGPAGPRRGAGSARRRAVVARSQGSRAAGAVDRAAHAAGPAVAPPARAARAQHGATLALDYALAHPREIVGVVASAPALKTAMPPWWKLVLANVARATTPSLGFPHGLDETGISRDPEVMRERADDRLMHGKISPRLYHDLVEAQQRVMRDARRLAVPALLIRATRTASSIPRRGRVRGRGAEGAGEARHVPGRLPRGLQRAGSRTRGG